VPPFSGFTIQEDSEDESIMIPTNSSAIYQSTWDNIPKELKLYHHCQNLHHHHDHHVHEGVGRFNIP
jgi:hypothetical protein